MEKTVAHIELEKAFKELQTQLDEANETIEAIRTGQVDALVVHGNDGHQLFTLKSADQTYRIFIEQMTEGAVTLNKFNEILYSNSQFASLLQLPLTKVTGHSFFDFVDDVDLNYAKKLVEEVWHDNPQKGELNLKTGSGSKTAVQLSLKILDLDEGPSMSIIFTDLTKLKQAQALLELKNDQLLIAQTHVLEMNNNLENTVAIRTKELAFNIYEKIKVEQELRRNEARLTSILQTMGEGLCILDEDGNVTFANSMAGQLFALDENEILTKNYFTLQLECFSIDGKIMQPDQHPIARLLSSSHSVTDQEILILNSNKNSLYISVNATGLFDEENKLSGVVSTFIDVTNRRKIALQKDEFISVASHELKTPLTSLKAAMQLLTRVIKQDKNAPKIPELIEKANSNLTKLVSLTEDLMNVSKFQHGPLPLNKELVNLYNLLNECVDQVIKRNDFVLNIKGDLSIEVEADKQRLEQVILNLLNNIKKYAADSKEINVKISRDQNFAEVQIRDFGPGIPADKLFNLFDRYFQVDPSGNQSNGLGLGLYISSEIIKRHGGKLTVESVVGQGSTFAFSLPLKNVDIV